MGVDGAAIRIGQLHTGIEPGAAVGGIIDRNGIQPDGVVSAHIAEQQGAIHHQGHAGQGAVEARIGLVESCLQPELISIAKFAIGLEQVQALQMDGPIASAIGEGEACIRASQHRCGVDGGIARGRAER